MKVYKVGVYFQEYGPQLDGNDTIFEFEIEAKNEAEAQEKATEHVFTHIGVEIMPMEEGA